MCVCVWGGGLGTSVSYTGHAREDPHLTTTFVHHLSKATPYCEFQVFPLYTTQCAAAALATKGLSRPWNKSRSNQ